MTDFDHTARVELRPETRAYLRDWLAWVERGAPDEEPYYRCMGLCSNSPSDLEGNDLSAVFGAAGTITPFGGVDYVERGLAGTQHEDPKRLTWVRVNAPDEEPTP